MSEPDFAQMAKDTKRVWLQRRDEWYPNAFQQFGWPHLGGDEWGRRCITIGFFFLGYISIAFRTCYCPECHEMRDQTYRIWRKEF